MCICATVLDVPTRRVPAKTSIADSRKVPSRPNLFVTRSVPSEPINPPMVKIEVMTPNCVNCRQQQYFRSSVKAHGHIYASFQGSPMARPMIEITSHSILNPVKTRDSHPILRHVRSGPYSRPSKSQCRHFSSLHCPSMRTIYVQKEIKCTAEAITNDDGGWRLISPVPVKKTPKAEKVLPVQTGAECTGILLNPLEKSTRF